MAERDRERGRRTGRARASVVDDGEDTERLRNGFSCVRRREAATKLTA